MITFCSLLWDANEKSEEFSRAYDESWAVKLFNGFRRHCGVPFRCVLYTDRQRDLPKNIIQEVRPGLGKIGYGDCIQPYEMNVPMILVGLDTIVVANIDKLVRYCFEADRIALPKHPYEDFSINGVQLVPAGQRHIFDTWRGENDMKWLRQFPHNRIDDLWPGKVVSYRAHVRRDGVGKARIIYFHGRMKPPELLHEPLIRDNWR